MSRSTPLRARLLNIFVAFALIVGILMSFAWMGAIGVLAYDLVVWAIE